MPTIAESFIITTPAVAALAEMVNKEETPAAGQEETGKPPAAEGDAIGSADDIVVESKEGEQEDGNAVANTTATDTPDLSSQKQEILNRQEDFDYSAVVYSPEEIETLFPSVPQWLREFLASQPVATHNETLRDPDAKFIVLTCHTFKGGTFSEACGGLSDRLMRLTYYAWVAHNSGRKLLIKWSQPHPLEEFFDVANDFDWRLPDGFADLEWEIYANRSFTQYKGERRIVWHPIISRQEHKDKRFIFANSNIAKIPVSQEFCAKQMGLENQHEAKGAIFHTLFKPSTKLMELVKSMYVDNPDLKPRSFAAAHVRAKWKEPNDLAILLNKRAGDQIGGGLKMSDPVNKVNVERLADNAANCAKKAMPDTQFIYVASDSDEIPTYLIEESPQWSVNSTTAAPHAKIIARPNYRVESKHLNSNGSPIEAYLGIFLDVWMMSTSQCLAQGLGGFGHLGSELSGNHYSCRVRHRQYGMPILLECPRPGEEMQALRERHNEDKRLAALSVPSSTPSSVPVSPSSAPSSNQTSDQQLNTTITSP
eukprot:scaffold5718_cov265-Chaetoceros_neogracile.AAC.15